VRSSRRLKFKYPAHAALRVHVFHRDGYACVHCGAKAASVPENYDGKDALATNVFICGWPLYLVLDHKLTLPAGGRSVIENLQTLCERCNRRKQPEDKKATAAYLAGGK
jgi:5-methylcytosine-specific restriction endonuclease McrA